MSKGEVRRSGPHEEGSLVPGGLESQFQVYPALRAPRRAACWAVMSTPLRGCFFAVCATVATGALVLKPPRIRSDCRMVFCDTRESPSQSAVTGDIRVRVGQLCRPRGTRIAVPVYPALRAPRRAACRAIMSTPVRGCYFAVCSQCRKPEPSFHRLIVGDEKVK